MTMGYFSLTLEMSSYGELISVLLAHISGFTIKDFLSKLSGKISFYKYHLQYLVSFRIFIVKYTLQ